jgi:hypothetical protein
VRANNANGIGKSVGMLPSLRNGIRTQQETETIAAPLYNNKKSTIPGTNVRAGLTVARVTE